MPGRVVSQYDKEDIEALGLVKIDLLSLRTLGVVSECLDRIERDTGQRIDLDSLPHDDPEVFRTISCRRHGGHVPGREPGPDAGAAQGAAGALRGPGGPGGDHPARPGAGQRGPSRTCAGAPGRSEVTYLHPSLEPILSDTLGVILYQEQVMQVAIEVCGYTALEADIFRKAMGSHRSHQKMQAERDRFVGGAMRTGLTEPDADELFRRCSAFAEFGFARAHAAAFAKITYDTAWLKLALPGALLRRRAEQPADGLLLAGRDRGRRQAPRDQGAVGRRQRVGLGARHAPAAGRQLRAAAGHAPGEGDRRVVARDAGARARHRSVRRRARLRGPHGPGRAGGRAADRHRCLRLDRCAPPRAALAAAHDHGGCQPGASRAGPDR